MGSHPEMEGVERLAQRVEVLAESLGVELVDFDIEVDFVAGVEHLVRCSFVLPDVPDDGFDELIANEDWSRQ